MDHGALAIIIGICATLFGLPSVI